GTPRLADMSKCADARSRRTLASSNVMALPLPHLRAREVSHVDVQAGTNLYRARTGRAGRDRHPRVRELEAFAPGVYSALCHTARPTKNGPRRSRYSDVCCVFLIVWTMAESG